MFKLLLLKMLDSKQYPAKNHCFLLASFEAPVYDMFGQDTPRVNSMDGSGVLLTRIWHQEKIVNTYASFCLERGKDVVTHHTTQHECEEHSLANL